MEIQTNIRRKIYILTKKKDYEKAKQYLEKTDKYNNKFSSYFNNIDIYLSFTSRDAARIKEIERTTNHDVKAVEYFIKERFDALGLTDEKEFVHFGLTSQDINNTAFPLMIREAVKHVFLPELRGLIDQLKFYAEEWAGVSMLARTHGQPASPTRLGKELEV